MTGRNNYKPTYAQIDLKAFSNNIDITKQLSHSDIIAVVKADAYGHGAIEISKFAYNKKGVRVFAVASFCEAMEIRTVLPKNAEIIVFGYTPETCAKEAIEANITLCVYDANSAKILSEAAKKVGKKVKTALKIDTGMSRIGFSDTLNLIDFFTNYVYIDIKYVMTHLATNGDKYSENQIELFENFSKVNEKSLLGVSSSVLASGSLMSQNNRWTYTRPGIILYGYGSVLPNVSLDPVMSVYSKIVHLKRLKKGEAVGYERTFIAKRNMTVGVVPIGYADGYHRAFKKGYMVIDGVKCSVLGNVCMDMTMIDVSLIGERALGMDVEVMGQNVNADKLASWADTISYEILCGISKQRIERIYINGE